MHCNYVTMLPVGFVRRHPVMMADAGNDLYIPIGK